MEVSILDSLYRRTAVVDRFESLIWTERHRAWGDFELKVHSTSENRNRFSLGQRLVINESWRVMTVETVEDSTDDEGRATLTLKGRSLEAILENRIARSALSDLTTLPKWEITGLPAVIARKLFHDICVTGVLNAGDIISGVSELNVFGSDNIPEPTDTITYSMEPMTLYQATKDLCDIYLMGFRLIRDPSTSLLYYNIYTGSDRTSGQTTLPAVIFSPDFDNLKNTSEISTTALYKNVAYVISPVGHEVVYALDVDPSVAGFERSVLLVKADDITDTVPADASAKMIQRGIQELAKNRRISAFDGEISQTSQYKYGIHYNLGDITELRDSDGSKTRMQVTEQIFSSDSEGDRSYPTLSIESFIVPGSWDSQTADEVWDAVSSSLVWDAA